MGVPRHQDRDHRVGRGPTDEPGVCHGTPQLRHVVLLHQPGHRPARALEREEHGQVREEGVRVAQAPRREGGGPPPRKAWCETHQALEGSGRLH